MIELSVVIPAFNREPLIGEAIESVLSQKFDADYEIVVADDASTDRTAEVARSFGSRVRVLLSPRNLGGAAARNAAIRSARGELIALLDSDDRALPGRLQIQADYLRLHPDVGLVSSSVQHEQGDSPDDYYRLRGLDVPPGQWRQLDHPLPHVVTGFIANSSATTARKSVLLKAGLYDETLFNPDLEILFRLARTTKFACYNAPLSWIRAPRPNPSAPPSQPALKHVHQVWRKILRETPELDANDRRTIEARIQSSLIPYFAHLYLHQDARTLRRAIAESAREGDAAPALLRKWSVISRIPRPLGRSLSSWKSRCGAAIR